MIGPRRTLLLVFAWVLSGFAAAADVPPQASVDGKYSGLIQILPCPSDQAQYGQFTDYGRWGGGAWCGQTGKAGYWVWVNPNWYVWKRQVPMSASANGKYGGLIQVLTCPADQARYGSFKDYGYWGGGAWCGQQGKAGYWVWANPSWYVWANKRQ